jgi:hypothetical protein
MGLQPNGKQAAPPPPAEMGLQPNGKQAAPMPRLEKAIVDIVRDPEFSNSMRNQDYLNMLSQLVANRQAMGQDYNLMPIGNYNANTFGSTQGTQTKSSQDFIDSRQPGSSYTSDMVNYIDPATGERVSRTRGIVPAPGSRFVPENGPQVGQRQQAQTSPQNAIAYQSNPDGSTNPIQAPKPVVGDQSIGRPVGVQPNFQIPQMPLTPATTQMANYNQILQSGRQRSQDMNQAAQNFAAPAGPAKSFSQVVGGANRTFKSGRQKPANFNNPSTPTAF